MKPTQFELWLHRFSGQGLLKKAGYKADYLDDRFDLAFAFYSDSYENAIESIIGFTDEVCDSPTSINIPEINRQIVISETTIAEI